MTPIPPSQSEDGREFARLQLKTPSTLLNLEVKARHHPHHTGVSRMSALVVAISSVALFVETKTRKTWFINTTTLGCVLCVRAHLPNHQKGKPMVDHSCNIESKNNACPFSPFSTSSCRRT